VSILKHPVNPVYYRDVVYAGFAWTTPGKEEVVNVWNTFSSKIPARVLLIRVTLG